MKAKSSIAESLTLSRLDQIKVLSDSRRYRIFEALARGPVSAKGLALRWDLKPASLHYHFRVLESAGLIRKVSERKARGTVEKLFEAVAARVHLAPGRDPAMQDASLTVKARAMEAGLDDVLRAETARSAGAAVELEVRRYIVRLSGARGKTIRVKLAELLEEFDGAQEPDGDEYRFTMALCRETQTEV
ncbi:MAG: helix-turn-helix transcriptional regulator [Candidatus Hydrogenedentes bacterium]|nr:helix-turn-helix transcriptional regulator [Candidatus Hydrogenedentota bacterium]